MSASAASWNDERRQMCWRATSARHVFNAVKRTAASLSRSARRVAHPTLRRAAASTGEPVIARDAQLDGDVTLEDGSRVVRQRQCIEFAFDVDAAARDQWRNTARHRGSAMSAPMPTCSTE
jgi:hypothetical protein